nr:Msy2 [Starmerella bombicola]
MNRRSSDVSEDVSASSRQGFVTPENSITAAARRYPEHSAPAYSENPYLANRSERSLETAAEQFGTSHTHERANAGVGSEGARHSTSSQRPSVTASVNSERRNLAGSIKSYFRRGSHSSHRSKNENVEEEIEKEDIKEPEEKEPETAEEYEKQMEDPQHLLDTILEEPEEDAGAPMMPISDAAEAVGAADSPEQARTEAAQRRQGYRENLLRKRRLRKHTKASRTIMKMRKYYRKVMGMSLITRLFVYWLPLAVILFIPLACGAWQNPNMALGGTRVMWIFIWLEVVWASLFIAKVFSHYSPEVLGYILSIFMPKYFKFVDMFLRLELAVQLVIWSFISFITFPPILTDNSNALDKTKYTQQPHWQKIVQDVLVAILVSAIIFLVEQVLIYLLSTNFHKTRMSLRIENQKRSVNTLIILLDLAYGFFPYQCEEFFEEDEALRYAAFRRATKKVGGVTSSNKMLNKVRNTMNNAARNVGNIVAEATKDGGEKKPSAAKIVKNSLPNRETREVLASRIWKSLVMEDSNALTYEDLLSIFGKDRKEEVLFMFDILDSDGQNGIELEEMIDSVNRIGRESKQISKSLIDIDGAITKLHYLLMCIALILVVVIFVGMLAPSSATVLATLGSTLLSMSFLFSSTAQEVFQSCVFLFVKHPFDTGDWIQTSVPNVGLVRMQVREMNLMYSVFNQIGVNTRRQVANSVLNSQWVDNISRSPPSQISIVLTIGVPETTVEQLEEFELRLGEFVEANPRDYAPGVFFQAIDQTDLDRLSLNICINTRNNQDDIVLFSARRTRAFKFIGQCIHDIPITIPRREDTTFHDPALPLFQYNVTDPEEAMLFVEKAKGKRKPYGMLTPEDDTASVAVEDGYVDNEIGTTSADAVRAATGAVEDSRNNSGTTRRLSFSSRHSRTSRAFTSASRASNTFGLRSRGQKLGHTNLGVEQ